jgi:nucleoside-diphosphate-sugar epimerase
MNGSQSVLVTGANGFIGSALVAHLAAAGWRVTGSGRNKPVALPRSIEWRKYDLSWSTLPADFFDGIDVVIHAAMARRSGDDYAINVAGSTLLLDEAHKRGIDRFAFFSSLAAHESALSIYGRQKYAIEQVVHSRGGLVIRPGLVLGPAGAFGAMCDYLRSHRFVPLFAGGGQPLQTIYVGDLIEATGAALADDLRGTFTAAEIDPVKYRVFYEALCERIGNRVTFVPIPFWAAELAISTAAALRVALPIDRDSVLGLRAMRRDSGTRLPGLPARTYRENIELAMLSPQ